MADMGIAYIIRLIGMTFSEALPVISWKDGLEARYPRKMDGKLTALPFLSGFYLLFQ